MGLGSTVLSQAVYSSTLVPNSCSSGTSWSARNESLGPSKVLTSKMQNPVYVCGLLDSQEYVRTFQSLPLPIFNFLIFWLASG